MEKMTNVKALAYVLGNCELPEDVREKVENIHGSYVKKSAASGERKPTERQNENAAIQAAVVEWFATTTEKYSATDVLKACPACADIPTTQRLTPILKKAVEAGQIGSEVEKRRTLYFAL